MSVFHRPKRNREVATHFADGSLIPCRGTHMWGGTIPYVNPDIHSVQNETLLGAKCDCGSRYYDEGFNCGCNDKKWVIKTKLKDE